MLKNRNSKPISSPISSCVVCQQSVCVVVVLVAAIETAESIAVETVVILVARVGIVSVLLNVDSSSFGLRT